jgi:ASC-1-like (ASCH) protein
LHLSSVRGANRKVIRNGDFFCYATYAIFVKMKTFKSYQTIGQLEKRKAGKEILASFSSTD